MGLGFEAAAIRAQRLFLLHSFAAFEANLKNAFSLPRLAQLALLVLPTPVYGLEPNWHSTGFSC